jgi:hypothetical protein
MGALDCLGRADVWQPVRASVLEGVQLRVASTVRAIQSRSIADGPSSLVFSTSEGKASVVPRSIT